MCSVKDITSGWAYEKLFKLQWNGKVCQTLKKLKKNSVYLNK